MVVVADTAVVLVAGFVVLLAQSHLTGQPSLSYSIVQWCAQWTLGGQVVDLVMVIVVVLGHVQPTAQPL